MKPGFASLRPAAAALPMLACALALSPAYPAADDCAQQIIRQEETEAGFIRTIALPGKLHGVAWPRAGGRPRAAYFLVGHPQDTASSLETVVRQAAISGELLSALRQQGEVKRGPHRPAIDLRDFDFDAPDALQHLGRLLVAAGLPRSAWPAPAASCPQPDPSRKATLYRLDSETPAALRPLTVAPPPGARALLALDLDGDEWDSLLLESGSGIHTLDLDTTGAPGTPLLLLTPEVPGLRTEQPSRVAFPPEPSGVRSPLQDDEPARPRRHLEGGPWVDPTGFQRPLHLRATLPGRLQLFTPGPAGEPWQTTTTVSLPLRSTPVTSHVLMATPQVRVAGRDAHGRLLLAAGPVPFGRERLLTRIISLGEDLQPRQATFWSRLPEGEVIQDSGYFTLGGEPFLWVGSEPGRGVEFFGSTRHLRLYRLSTDRSGAGVEPVVRLDDAPPEVLTPLIAGRDVDGDGLDDVVLAGHDGNAVLSAYLQLADGRFRQRRLKQVMAAEGVPLAFGDDLNADGQPDLAVASRQQLSLFAGQPPAVAGGRMTLVAEKPLWSLPRQRRSEEHPGRVNCRTEDGFFVDIQGDGLADWICSGRDGHGRDAIKVLSAKPAPGPPRRSGSPSPPASGDSVSTGSALPSRGGE